MVSFVRDLPPDLEEAARVDGASRLRALWEVIVPLTAPGVFASAILSFIAVWNDFLFGLTLTTDEHAQPVTVGVTRFAGEHTIPWGEIAPAGHCRAFPAKTDCLWSHRWRCQRLNLCEGGPCRARYDW
jgi:ABC-type glycerol-3-phosphate transport system permease component